MFAYLKPKLGSSHGRCVYKFIIICTIIIILLYIDIHYNNNIYIYIYIDKYAIASYYMQISPGFTLCPVNMGQDQRLRVWHVNTWLLEQHVHELSGAQD